MVRRAALILEGWPRRPIAEGQSENVNSLTRLVLILFLVVVGAIVVAQNWAIIVSVLLAALLLLVIARLAWPSRRR